MTSRKVRCIEVIFSSLKVRNVVICGILSLAFYKTRQNYEVVLVCLAPNGGTSCS